MCNCKMLELAKTEILAPGASSNVNLLLMHVSLSRGIVTEYSHTGCRTRSRSNVAAWLK